MNLTETNSLLAFIALYDNRRIDDATVVAWHAVLDDLDLPDCREAVVQHFRTSDVYLVPVHIRRLVDEIVRDRRRLELDRKAEQAALEMAADPTRYDRSPAVSALLAELRDRLPEGDPDSLRYGRRHWREVAAARERQENAKPNPLFDPAALSKLAQMTREE